MNQIVRYVAVAILGMASFASSAPLFAQQGYVHEVSGTVMGQVGSGQAARVDKGMTLPVGSTISTEANSYAVLKFEDGTVILLKQNTAFQVQAYSFNPKAPENANAVFSLVRGGLRFVSGLITSKNRDAVRVATPMVTIGIRGTEFTAELTNPLFVGVQVGAVGLTNAGGSLVVSAGQFASVATAGQLGSLIPATQLPAGVLQFPKVALPPANPVTVSSVGTGGTIGGGIGGAAGAGTAAVVGAAAVAGVAASNNNSSTSTTHH
jgi:FecR protein